MGEALLTEPTSPQPLATSSDQGKKARTVGQGAGGDWVRKEGVKVEVGRGRKGLGKGKRSFHPGNYIMAGKDRQQDWNRRKLYNVNM